MDNIAPILFRFLVMVVMAVGLAGLILPVLPGLVIIWAAALVFGLVEGFSTAGIIIMVILTFFATTGSLIDNFLLGASARSSGASWLAAGAAVLAAVVGSLLAPPLGGIIAALIVVFAFEIYRLKNWREALVSAKGIAYSLGWSMIARSLMGFIMILLWGLWAFFFQPV